MTAGRLHLHRGPSSESLHTCGSRGSFHAPLKIVMCSSYDQPTFVFLPISMPIVAMVAIDLLDMACSFDRQPLPASLAGEAGARPDHSISGHRRIDQARAEEHMRGPAPEQLREHAYGRQEVAVGHALAQRADRQR